MLPRLTDHVLFLTLVALAPVAVLAPKGTVVVLAIGILATLGGQPWRDSLGAFRRPTHALLVAALMLWSLASLFWAPSPETAFNLWLRMLWIMAGGVLLLARLEGLSAAAAARLRTAVALLGALIVALLLFEVLSARLLTRLVRLGEVDPLWGDHYLARGAALLAVFAWPCAYAIWRRAGRGASLVFLALACALLVYLPMLAALVAFGVGALVFLVARRWPLATVRGAGAVVLLAIAIAPFALAWTGVVPWLVAAAPEIEPSWHHRLLTWQLVAELVAERPLLGWGLDASRDLPVPPDFPYGKIPRHPHNALLQLWVELGLPGAVLGGALVALVIAGARRAAAQPTVLAVRLATFAAFLTIALLSFGMWQNWWLAAGWLSAYLTLIAVGGEGAGA